MISLSTNVLGVFALKDGRIIKYYPFPEDPKKIAEALSETKKGVCNLEKKLIEELIRSKTNEFAVDSPNRFYGLGFDASFTREENPQDVFSLSEEMGADPKKIQKLIYEVNVESTKNELKSPERDQLIIQAVKSLDELEDSINLLSERLREWYSLHFPELDYVVQKHELYARLVAEAGDRKNVVNVKSGLDSGFMKRIAEASENSFGFEFTSKDAQEIKSLADSVVAMDETRKSTEVYIEELMREIAPNLSHLVGPPLGAKLIAKAGNLQKLARMPSGTIQILGAEDAFFRFLKTGKNPPKHGIIFTYPDIRSSPKKIRGKLARTLAAKLAIAAKSDAFQGKFIADKLSGELKERLKSLKRG
jgi:nucleolar protein 56